MTQLKLEEFDNIDRENLKALEERAIQLLQANEPPEGYYLAFSGGKDSCVLKHLADKAGVKYVAHYHNTTIDPPELVKFIKKYHPDAKWNRPKMNMMKRVAERKGTPPTRRGRWCCEEYKEIVGDISAVMLVGVRAAESKARAKRWEEVKEEKAAKKHLRQKYVCPIVYWTDDDVWTYIKDNEIPYCSLYDEGFTRIGCVCCPLASKKNRDKEAKRWPRMYNNWKRAVMRNWENRKDGLNSRTGKPLYQAKFKTAEDFWLWWWEEKPPTEEDCQMENMFTNADPEE